jgi:hypothetical protein
MASNPVATLKKGLAEFSKSKSFNKIVKNEKLSNDDEHWLDHEANTVDERRVLDILEAALDYEKEIET